MSFIQYLKEYELLQSINLQELIDLMNNIKQEELNKSAENDFFKKYGNNKEPSFTKIDNVINKLKNLQTLKGIPLLSKFIESLKDNGFFQDSKPIIELINKYGSKVIDIYVSSEEDAPEFLKKGIKN